MGLVCIQNSSLLVYGKSQKVSASYCLPFQHSRGKNQPVGGLPPPPTCSGLRGEATRYCQNCDSLAVVVVAHFDPGLAGCHLAAIGRAEEYFCRL